MLLNICVIYHSYKATIGYRKLPEGKVEAMLNKIL